MQYWFCLIMGMFAVGCGVFLLARAFADDLANPARVRFMVREDVSVTRGGREESLSPGTWFELRPNSTLTVGTAGIKVDPNGGVNDQY